MEDVGLTFNFEDGITVTGGGWKTEEGRSIPPDKFRKRVRDNFGIPEENCRDLYGMNESNLITFTCEGHYRHTLHSLLYPIVLDEKMEPVGFGEYGRYAFLDPLANSYPGFIVTGDRVKLMEHCPECNRPGPVIGPDVPRMPGSEGRGCAITMGKMLKEAGE
jgi:Acyl-protein synthetase, LuxE.